MSTLVTKAEARVAATLATESSVTAAVIAALSQILALIVGFGIINSTQEGVIIGVTTAAVNAGALIAHAIHTGKINPSAVETHLLALVAQVVALFVAFAVIGTGTAATITAATIAVLGAAVQIAHALQSQKVPTSTPAPAPAPTVQLGEITPKPVEISDASIKALADAVKPAKSAKAA